MNRGSIKSELYAWLSSMTMKYNWLQVKLEYKEDRGVFLVSFSPVSQIELSEEFNREAMQFADEMNISVFMVTKHLYSPMKKHSLRYQIMCIFNIV